VTAAPAVAGTLKCPLDAVKVGNVCIDLYEASVWQIDPANQLGMETDVPFKREKAEVEGDRGSSIGFPLGALALPAQPATL
jgi:hypothetical protein